MVKIRLRRMGAKKAPFYRIVVADSRYPRDGRFIEEIGTYNPLTTPAELKVDAERAQAWIKTGAQPTDTVRSLSLIHIWSCGSAAWRGCCGWRLPPPPGGSAGPVESGRDWPRGTGPSCFTRPP